MKPSPAGRLRRARQPPSLRTAPQPTRQVFFHPTTIDHVHVHNTALQQEAERTARPVRSLISNAGAYPRVPWHDHDPATFARQIDVNLLTHAAVMHLLAPGLTTSGTGRIVAVSSVLT